MSLLRWIGEEDDAQDCEKGCALPPLPEVYRLNEPETSAEEPSADFSAFEEDWVPFADVDPDGDSADEDALYGDFMEENAADGTFVPAILTENAFPEEDAADAPVSSGRKKRSFAPAARQLPSGGAVLSDVRPTGKGRMALFCRNIAGEEEFLFSVDEETCVLQHLKPGVRLSAAELEAVRSRSDLRRAKDRALQYISVRDHASGELYRKLCEKFDELTAAAAVAEMHRLGLLDDAAFAVRRAAHLAKKGKSRREIDRTLAGLGVGREERAAALEQLPQEEEETLRALVEKQYKSKLAAGKRDNVAAALLRRGYSGALVRRVLAELDEE